MTIRLDDITLTYPDGDSRLTALDAVSLQVDAGELAVVTGPSGSGKSSLLAVAATLVRPDAGRVVLAGVDVTDLGQAARSQVRLRHVGIVFQQPNLVPALTAREQLEVVARIRGTGDRQARSRADELLAAVGLEAHLDRRPHQLSGGQRQRVAIARALVTRPEVLLVDEPTSALDSERGAAVMSLIRRLSAHEGSATLLVTHDTQHIRDDDRVVRVEDGRVRQEYAVAAG